jgi:ABC-type proline/glycine betaine transport system substrate-binding protein
MKKKIIISVIIVLLVAVASVGVYIFMNSKTGKNGGEKVDNSEKSITITVTNSKMETQTYNVVTKNRFIKDALDEAAGLNVEYIESEDGATISGVNGEVLDNKQQFWTFTLNDDFCQKPVDKQEIKDGDKIAIYFSTM